MPIDFTLNDNQRRLQREARQFAEDVLSGVPVAARDLPSPIERFVATRPFFERLVAEGFLRKCIPVSVGGDCAGLVDLAILAEEFYTVDANVSLTMLSTVLGLAPLVVGGTPEQHRRFLPPFLATKGAPLAAFASTEPGGSANVGSPPPGEGVRTTARRLATRGLSRAGSNGYLRPPDGTDRVPTCSPSSAAPIPKSNPRVASRSSLCLVPTAA
jgi:alkylation response protein AidB-like acyl-CoA dehydrogenase